MDPTSLGATHCADENFNIEECYGPGIVYYGYGSHRTTKILVDGESVICGKAGFGCDPFPNQVKDCYLLETGTWTLSDNYDLTNPILSVCPLRC